MESEIVEGLQPMLMQALGLVLLVGIGAVLLRALGHALLGRGSARALSRRSVALSQTPLWNRSEGELHRHLLALAAERDYARLGISVHAQLGLLAVIDIEARGCDWTRAFDAIARERFDFVLADADGRALAAIEHLGAARAGRTGDARDAVKRVVCGRAGLALIEIAGDEGPADYLPRIRDAIAQAVRIVRKPADQPGPPARRGASALTR